MIMRKIRILPMTAIITTYSTIAIGTGIFTHTVHNIMIGLCAAVVAYTYYREERQQKL